MQSKKKTIGFIGLGLMGQAFTNNLMEDGYEIFGTDPVPLARRRFKRKGGKVLDSPKEVVENADITFISVPNSKISLNCAKGPNGYTHIKKKNSKKIIIDTTTSDPDDTRKISSLCKTSKLDFLEGCISGNSKDVKNRIGLFLIGGEEKIHKKIKPLLDNLLSDQIYCGKAGSGATMKVIINYLTCLERCSIAETLRIGLRSGIKKDLLLECLLRSAASGKQLEKRGARMLGHKFSDPVSSLATMIKDMKLGLTLAKKTESSTPVGKACLPIYQLGGKSDYGELDSSVIYKVFEDLETK